MIGKAGDRIVVESVHVGEPPRAGKILEVTSTPSGPHYRVKWEDGHESSFIPSAGNARILPAGKRRAS